MKEVVTGGEFYLVVQGVGCREAVENSAIGHVNVGKGGSLRLLRISSLEIRAVASAAWR